MRSRGGFTFIEIMIVIVILLGIMALALPKMGGTFRRSELLSSTRDVAGMLRYARHAAVLRGDGCQVTINPGAGTYLISMVHVNADGEPVDDWKKKPSKKSKENEKYEKEFRFSDDVQGTHVLAKSALFTLVHSTAPLDEKGRLPRIIFYPDGSATPGTIAIEGADGKAFAIQIYRTTGLATVHEGKATLAPGESPLFATKEYQPQPMEPTYKDDSLLERLRRNER